ncbi:hypothetical protein AMTRI_Chr04g252080 [Amborella trichopoda]
MFIDLLNLQHFGCLRFIIKGAYKFLVILRVCQFTIKVPINSFLSLFKLKMKVVFLSHNSCLTKLDAEGVSAQMLCKVDLPFNPCTDDYACIRECRKQALFGGICTKPTICQCNIIC